MKTPSRLWSHGSPLTHAMLFLVVFASAWGTIECFNTNFHRSAILRHKISAPNTIRTRLSTRMQGTSDAILEAERLRQKAKELMEEANTAEIALRSSKRQAVEIKRTQLDEIYNDLTSGFLVEGEGAIDLTSEKDIHRRVADKLKKRRLSSTTMIQMIERLYERLLDAERRIKNSTIGANTSTGTGTDTPFNIGDLSNSMEFNEGELRNLQLWIERIIVAQSLVDVDSGDAASFRADGTNRGLAPILEARIRELRRAEEEIYQRNLARTLNKIEQLNVGSFVTQTLGEQNVTIKIDGKEVTGPQLNITRLMEDMTRTPMWVPPSILPFLIVCRKELDPDDLKKIRSEVLGGSQFGVVNWDFTRIAAVYRGTFVNKQRAALYGTSSITASDSSDQEEGQEKQSEIVFREVQKRLEQAGLADKIQLFLMEDPEWRPGDRDPEPLPSILAVSSEVIPEQGSERGQSQTLIAVSIPFVAHAFGSKLAMYSILPFKHDATQGIAVLSTLFATFVYAVSGFALNQNFFNAVVNNNDISMISSCLPIIIGVFGVSAIHEAAHYIAAKRSEVKLGLPVPLPSLQIGTFGSITPLRSFPKSRTAMFDVSMSGPLAGALTSIVMMVTGIFMTVQSSTESISTLAVVPAAIMKTSFLVGTIASVMAPKVMAMPLSQLIPIHPLFLAGFAGLVSSALNLLPIGRLDGGRACTAIFGRRSSYLVSLATLLFLAIAALTQTSAISIFWGLVVTLFQRNAEIPMRDELTDVDNVRVGVYIFSILLTVLTLAPFPGGPAL